MNYLLRICLIVLFASNNLQAQDMVEDAPLKKKKFSYSSGIEASIVQFARFSSPFKTAGLKSIPRYTYFWNTGIDLNYKLTKNLKPFTGIQLKNLGLIYQYNDSTKYKFRVYTLGAPIGIKWTSNNNKLNFKTGLDIAMAFNYKWKYFKNDKKMSKKNEFFGDTSSLLFSSVFAGVSYGGFSVAGNVYLNQFFNEKTAGVANNARLITLSFGITLDENTLKKKQSNKKE